MATLLSAPTDPNSRGYQEYLNRGGTGYAFDEGVSSSTPSNPAFAGIPQANIAPVSTTGGVNNLMANTQYGETLKPTGQMSSITPIAPKGPTPTMGALPGLIVPEMDESKIRSLTQQISSPAIRGLRRTTREALMRHYDNPNVAKMVARETLAGLGDSLSQALTAAGTQARGEEREGRQIKANAAMTEYQAKVNQQMAVYNAAWNNYMQKYGQSNISTYLYGTSAQNISGGVSSKKTMTTSSGMGSTSGEPLITPTESTEGGNVTRVKRSLSAGR